MKFLRIVLIALLPTQAFAAPALTQSDLKFMISACFDMFYAPAGQVYKIDRARMARLGYKPVKDDASYYEAYRTTDDASKLRRRDKDLLPVFEARRHNRKPNDLTFKSCQIKPGTTNGITGAKALELLHAEAKRRGFKPTRDKKGKPIWLRGAVGLNLDVTVYASRGKDIRNSAPEYLYVDGVHSRKMP